MSRTQAQPVLLFVALALGGCDKFVEAVNQGAQAAAEAAANQNGGLGGGPKTDDDFLGEKLNAYIGCINDHSRNVHDANDRYLDWVKDAKVGPTGKETSVYGLYEIRDPQRCVDESTKAADAQPDDPELEAAGKAFVDALVAARAVGNEAHKYYDEKNYQDDKWVKAKELHPKLMAAFEAFDKADKTLREQVATKNDALQQRELARIEGEMGKNLMWHNKNVMIVAKKVVELGDVAVEPDLALDLAKFEPALQELEAAVDATNAYAEAHKEETGSVTMFSSWQSGTEDLKKAAKELLRRKRDDKKFTKDDYERMVTGPAEWVEGSPAKLGKSYNDLVSNSNSLSWNWYKPDGKQ